MIESDDAELAARMAKAALDLLLRIRAEGLLEGGALGDAADVAANRLILDAIRQHRPADGLLSEESPDDRARLEHRRVWIVDPLDGTREYVAGRDDWAVHIGLAVDGVAALGAVATPRLGLFRSDQVEPATHDPARPPVMLVSRSRAPKQAALLASTIGAEIHPMGSAGAKAMAVVAGSADIYFHSGGQHEWDNCAPAAVAAAAGLHVSRCDGSALVYNRPSPFVHDLLICRPDLAAPVLAAIAGLPQA
jgi:3'(2'), 5'-bisphosphate nucleotidase